MSKQVVFQSAREMPPMAISLNDMGFNKTGGWRYLKPVYLEKLAPCRVSCPAGTDWPRVLTLAAEGQFIDAWRLIRAENPLPGICGRVCYHPCEAACNREHFDGAVSIQALERFIADACLDLRPETHQREPRSERVAVVGSGPAGLACAYFLARQGVGVTVLEAAREPGGMLRLAIPSYRLPRDILDKEIEDIAALGVKFQPGTRISSHVELEELWQSFDALFIATGAHHSRPLKIPGEDNAGVMTGLEFLRSVNADHDIEIGKRVIVIGGGNTAMDAARTALRLGAHPTVVYRRTRAEMPAIAEEIEEAEQEGIEFIFLAAPRQIRRVGNTLEVECIRVELGAPDASGRRHPVPIPNSEFVIETDCVLKAVGEEPELPFLSESMETSAGLVIHNPKGLLEREGIFIGGDAQSGPSTVIDAIASGKQAAKAIQLYLQHGHVRPPKRRDKRSLTEEIAFEHLNPDYFTPAPRADAPHLVPSTRTASFSEVKGAISREQAIAEAQRCFSCGVCNFCDNCRVFCPDVAISRVDSAYAVNAEFCKGCGICAEECPRGVISLVEEER